MHFQKFALKEDAFGRFSDRRFIFHSESFRRAHASLLQHVEGGEYALLLIGAPGTGKTTLLWHLAETLAQRNWLVHWRNPLLSADDATFPGWAVGETTNAQTRIDEVAQPAFFAEFVDDANDLPAAVLHDFCSPGAARGRPRRALLLAGTDALLEKLLGSARRFGFRVVRVQSLQPDEVELYVRHRLAAAGANGAEMFTPAALALIADYSRGILGTINRLAISALLLAEVTAKRCVDVDHVHEAAEDLGLVKPAWLHPHSSPAHGEDRSHIRQPPTVISRNTVEGATIILPSRENTMSSGSGVDAGEGSPIDRRIKGRRRGLAASVVAAAAMAVLFAWFAQQEGKIPQDRADRVDAGSIVSGASASGSVTSEMAGAPSADAPDFSALPPGGQTPPLEHQTASAEVGATRTDGDGKRNSEEALSLDLAGALAKGDDLTALGDIAAARLYYDYAMRHGSAEAARKLGLSYDPVFLGGFPVSGLQPDLEKAVAAYRAAADLGDLEALARIAAMSKGASKAPAK